MREFVDLPETADELRPVLDDLGLVVEGMDHVGEGIEDVVVARIDEIRAIEPALAGDYLGGFFTASDATGDIHAFTSGLAAACQRRGAPVSSP